MNLKIDKKRRILLSVIGTFILLGLVEVALCYPLVTAISKVDAGKKAYAQEIALARSLLSAKRGVGVVAQLTPKEQAGRMADVLKNIGQKNNVEFLALRSTRWMRDSDASFRRVFFDIEVAGSFRDIGQFLSAVRNAPEGIFNVESLRIGSDAAVPDKVKAKITFSLFVVKDNG